METEIAEKTDTIEIFGKWMQQLRELYPENFPKEIKEKITADFLGLTKIHNTATPEAEEAFKDLYKGHALKAMMEKTLSGGSSISSDNAEPVKKFLDTAETIGKVNEENPLGQLINSAMAPIKTIKETVKALGIEDFEKAVGAMFTDEGREKLKKTTQEAINSFSPEIAGKIDNTLKEITGFAEKLLGPEGIKGALGGLSKDIGHFTRLVNGNSLAKEAQKVVGRMTQMIAQRGPTRGFSLSQNN